METGSITGPSIQRRWCAISNTLPLRHVCGRSDQGGGRAIPRYRSVVSTGAARRLRLRGLSAADHTRSSRSALTQQAVGTPRRLAGAESGLRGPRAAVAGCRTGAAERLVHEAADGARAAAALGAAAETAIDPAGRARPLRRDGGADILIAQHIARTDDHGAMVLDGDLA
jgi:hypothetical protein